jgi:hypothetical protein
LLLLCSAAFHQKFQNISKLFGLEYLDGMLYQLSRRVTRGVVHGRALCLWVFGNVRVVSGEFSILKLVLTGLNLTSTMTWRMGSLGFFESWEDFTVEHEVCAVLTGHLTEILM